MWFSSTGIKYIVICCRDPFFAMQMGKHLWSNQCQTCFKTCFFDRGPVDTYTLSKVCKEALWRLTLSHLTLNKIMSHESADLAGLVETRLGCHTRGWMLGTQGESQLLWRVFVLVTSVQVNLLRVAGPTFGPHLFVCAKKMVLLRVYRS